MAGEAVPCEKGWAIRRGNLSDEQIIALLTKGADESLPKGAVYELRASISGWNSPAGYAWYYLPGMTGDLFLSPMPGKMVSNGGYLLFGRLKAGEPVPIMGEVADAE